MPGHISGSGAEGSDLRRTCGCLDAEGYSQPGGDRDAVALRSGLEVRDGEACIPSASGGAMRRVASPAVVSSETLSGVS